MQMMKWSVIALAVAAGTSQMALASSQSESKGFVEDSSADLLSRNFYINRDFKNNSSSSQSYFEEWAQGEMLEFQSGFTEGTVGFGVDAYGYMGLKLDTGDGRVSGSAGLLQQETKSNGGEHATDSYGTAGAAVKARVSNTVLKYGDQRTAAPVFATSDSRLLPETATGFNLMSEEVSGLTAEAGHFTAFKNRNGTDHQDGLKTIYSAVEADSISYLGATYAVSDELSASLYASEVSDNWRQYYSNLNYTTALTEEQSTGVDFNIYRTLSYGSEDSSSINNTTLSVAPFYAIGAHKFTIGYQQVRGDTPFDYVGGDSIFLANSVQISDFNLPGLKSWKAQYDLDMSTFGTPGLTFMARYVVGTGADSNDYEVSQHSQSVLDADNATYGLDVHGGKLWEQNFEAKYVIQDGVAKDLSFRLREAIYRANSEVNGADYKDNNEVRLIVEYPLSIL